MTERIDHAAESEKWIAYSADLNPASDWPRVAHATTLAAAHAALAGVEQQRIANLLTYLSLPIEVHGRESGAWAEVNEGLGQGLE